MTLIKPPIQICAQDKLAVKDPEKEKLAANAFFAVLQVVVSSAILFFLYRFLLSSLGVEALGVWSLVVSATSLANVSNLGLAGGTVRFVSKHLARGDARSAGLAVETAALSIAVVMGLVALLIWWVIDWLLGLVIPAAQLGEARQIVPFTLGALWLSSVGGAIHSGLDGCHRADLRSLVTIVTQPLLLLIAIWLVPDMGLKGIAYAQMLQNLVWLVLGWLVLRKHLPELSIMPWRWSRRLFLEMWRYGLNFQLISILMLLTEPLAKGLLSHYGNLSAVGYFELANRLIVQLRAILVSANQVLVSYYSKLGENSRETVRTLYLQNLNAIVLLGSLMFSSLVVMLPLISELWIGQLEPQFLLFSIMLAGGWFVNVLSAPAYFANMGIGEIKHNVLGHAVMPILVLAIGTVGGHIGGALGSATAWPLALIVGGAIVIQTFHHAEAIPIGVLFSLINSKALALGVGIVLLGFVPYYFLSVSEKLFAVLSTTAALTISFGLFMVVVPEIRTLLRLSKH